VSPDLSPSGRQATNRRVRRREGQESRWEIGGAFARMGVVSARVEEPQGVPATAVAALDKAIEEFNAWRFYDCHETLEDAWRELGGKASRRAGRAAETPDFYQGVIKVAAGFHHLLRGNHKGTVNLLSDSLRLLEPFRPSYLRVDVERLVPAVEACLRRVEELGPDQMPEFERSMIPLIERLEASG
jgi:predicted metal-dependent hydrolase